MKLSTYSRKNAVIYARYSSASQTEQSIEGQIRVISEYAVRENYTIIGTYIDRAMTGTNDNRPDFQQMISDSYRREFDYVIVYKLDRFSRNRYDSAINKKILRNNGVKVISATEMITDTPEGIIMESMLEGFKRSNGHKNLNYNQSSLINALSNHFYFRPKGSLYKAAFRLLTAY